MWRESATVMLAAFQPIIKQELFNYKVITLKRSSKNDFMPGRHVFPGGNINAADSNDSWLAHFKKFVYDIEALTSELETTPPIFKNTASRLPKLISLKITAVRETFEETGILLCRDATSSDKQDWTSFQVYPELSSWRSKVQKDATEFFNLCHHFECYPDVTSLKLWSNWLTPRKENKKRFDAAFFLATLKELPPSAADAVEVEQSEWFCPDELTRFSGTDIWLPPPQLYEVARLQRFKNIHDLSKFASERSLRGCARWMPERVNTLDGYVTILPGDSAYHAEDEVTGGNFPTLPVTNEQFRSQSRVLHRIEHTNEFDGKLVISNFSPQHGHVLPLA